MDAELNEKYNRLTDELRKIKKVAVAYSGGVDSTFLLWTAKSVLGDNAVAITVKLCSMPRKEYEETVQFCRDNKIKHEVLNINELEDAAFSQNPPNRCYICKKRNFTEICSRAHMLGIEHVLDGSNADDRGDYRPGMQAVKELGIRSPLMDLGFTKADIRAISKDKGIYTWDKPAYACLSTRIPYGDQITANKLAMIEKAENYLIENGFRQVRVRIHGDMARIEVPEEDIEGLISKEKRAKIVSELESVGFKYVSLDLKGYRMGSMNESLELKAKM